MSKIAIVTEFYYPFIGGVETRFKEIAEKFVHLGHDVDIYCIGHESNLKLVENINGVTVNRLFIDNNYYKKGILGRNILGMMKFPYYLYKDINKFKYDFIVFGQFSIFPIMLNKLFINKTFSVIDFVEYRFSKLWFVINTLLFKSVDKVVCINSFVEKTILLNHQFMQSNTVSIPSSVNLYEYEDSGEEDFIFIGRMEEHKNPEDAIKAVLLFNKKYNRNKILHLVGDGSLLLYLKNKYHASKNIVFHGFIDNKAKKNLLSKSKIMIFPSKREGLPMSFIESIACKVPIVTAKYEGNNAREFIEKEGVGVVSEVDIESLASSINKIENNYKEFKDACSKAIGNYDLTKNILKYLNINKEKK